MNAPGAERASRRVVLGVYSQIAADGRPVGVERDAVIDPRVQRYELTRPAPR